MTMADWRIYSRDVANRRLAEITVYRSFKCRSVYNGKGTWSLDMPANFDYFGIQPFRGRPFRSRTRKPKPVPETPQPPAAPETPGTPIAPIITG